MNPAHTAFGMVHITDDTDDPTAAVIGQMWTDFNRRHAWIGEAAKQIRAWKQEDADNGIIWEIEEQPREPGDANNAPGRNS